ncbi:MAG: hypothetical protein ACR2QC_04370 [Gammaproteobacteria bacterium]
MNDGEDSCFTQEWLCWSFWRKPESSVFFPQMERHLIPAFAGMTNERTARIPAFAGMV